MKTSEKSILEMIDRACKIPGEHLAYVGMERALVRGGAWRVMRQAVEQLSPPNSYRTIDGTEMSITFSNASKIRCFGADYPAQFCSGDIFSGMAFETQEIYKMFEMIETGLPHTQNVQTLPPVFGL